MMTKVKLYKKLKDTQFDAKWVYFYIFDIWKNSTLGSFILLSFDELFSFMVILQ